METWGCAWPALPGVLGAGRPAGLKHHRLHRGGGMGWGWGEGEAGALPHRVGGTILHSRLGGGRGAGGRGQGARAL